MSLLPSPSTRSESSFNPLGAIAALVELAIARWAGNESSSSSSSSLSSHSRRTKSLDISGLLQARKEERQIPRQFSLYLPPSLVPHGDPVFRTTDLSAILGLLDAALGGKGKHKESQSAERAMHKAWFLDVSSPTWEDMRAIGKLLHLHPLTLEDILVQDEREKLEHFDRLGYYVVSVKAIKSWDDKDWGQGDHGSVAESNVYLTVFREGICCFNFSDVSEHTDRVRNRLLQVDSVASMSSDWIAHGILDSIVDSFFPFLTNGLEKEVMSIENIVFSSSGFPMASVEPRTQEDEPMEKEGSEPLIRLVELSEKSLAQLEKSHLHPRRSSFFAKFSMPFLGRWMRSKSRTSPNTSTLQRMARARRLVTSLARLLSSKSEVVAQLRKRLLTTPGSPNGDSVEVAIYLGDVQDHILTLENSLAHYERMLSQSHPLYIAQMRTTVAITKGGTDKALLYLTAVSIGVLCIQTVQGVFSMNTTIPRNALGGNRYNMFAIVLSLDILILFWNCCTTGGGERRRGSLRRSENYLLCIVARAKNP
ncbi:hypothetical protein C8F01DRAFT_413176 [Mycena amicta]|nr:hypothetical protein C8F01DRAFT_413176 [Mycena amicta]